MSFELVCTACAARLRVPGFTPGRAVRCPKCASVFVPSVAPPPLSEPPAPPPAPVVVAPPPSPTPPPPEPAPPPPENPFDFDRKPEPQRTSAAAKNAKIVGAPNTKVVPRATPVASKPKPPADGDDAPAPKPKSADKPIRKARDREPEPRPISPTVLIGGLAFLALGAAIIAGVLIFGGDDKPDRAKRDPLPQHKDKVDPPKPPEPEPEPPEPEPEPKPKPVEKFKPPLFPALNPPGHVEPEPER